RRRDARRQRLHSQPQARIARLAARGGLAVMAQTVRFHRTGGPEVLHVEDVAVGRPGPGEARVRHAAVGLNFADTYFRKGVYPVALTAGMGVEAAGTVVEVGEGVTHVKAGDRVTYTGFLNTLGAYTTERVMPAAP